MNHISKLISTVCLTALIATGLRAQDMPKQSSVPATPAEAVNIRPAGMRLEWTHFIGGSAGDGVFEQPVSVLDRDGMLYFAGSTGSRDFPTTPDAVQAKFHGNSRRFSREVRYAPAEGGVFNLSGWGQRRGGVGSMCR
jgi:hypothetical protein